MKKTILIIGVLIIVVFTGVAIISIFLFNRSIEKDLMFDKELTITEKEITKADDYHISFEEFMKELRSKISDYCKEIEIREFKYERNKGFPWINEDNEIELIQGYRFSISSSADKNNKDLIEKCVLKITSYLEEDFTVSKKNTNDRVKGLERNNIKCAILSYSFNFFDFECGDVKDSLTPEIYRNIYHDLKLDHLSLNFNIHSLEEEFATVTISGRSGGGFWALLKKEDGKWRKLQGTQDQWECEIVFEHNIPHSIVDNRCYFYEKGESWHYNEELDKWEKR